MVVSFKRLTPSRIFFDNWEPGKRDYSGAKEAEKLYKKHTGEKISAQTQRHHKNWDRTDGNTHNIVIAKDQNEHDSWHRQMIKYIIDSVNTGLLKFSFKQRRYFTDDRYIIDKFKRLHQPVAA